MSAVQGLGTSEKVRRLTGDARIAISGARVIDGEHDTPIERATVVIRGQSIEDVLPAGAPMPEGTTQTIDATGMTLLPGLIDAHAHLDGLATKDPYRRFFSPSDGVKTLRAALEAQRYIEAGWTTVADLGVGKSIDLRAAIQSGVITGPRIIATVAPLSYTGGHVDWPIFPYEWVKERGWRGRIVDGPDECRKAVRLNFREGADMTKIMVTGGLGSSRKWSPSGAFTAPELDAIVDETRSQGGLVAAHCMGGGPGVRKAALAGVDSIEHGLIEKQDYDVLALLAERHIVLVPTLSAWHCIATEGRDKGYSDESIEAAARFVDLQNEMVRQAKRDGVHIAAGSDAHHRLTTGPASLELELLVEAGLTEMEAIVAATRTAAAARGLADVLGTIARGRRADMLLVKSDPLRDIRSLGARESIVTVFSTSMSSA